MENCDSGSIVVNGMSGGASDTTILGVLLTNISMSEVNSSNSMLSEMTVGVAGGEREREGEEGLGRVVVSSCEGVDNDDDGTLVSGGKELDGVGWMVTFPKETERKV